jgi:hypothetical protein
LTEVLNSVYALVRKFVEINSADFWWQTQPDVDPTQTENADFWTRVGAALRNEPGSRMPDIRSGKLFCKVLEYQALNLQADILVAMAEGGPMFQRARFLARLRAQCDFAGNTSWIATTIYTSDIRLQKHVLSPTKDDGGVKFFSILNRHMLMTHNAKALDMFCSGGYRLVRCMARLIHDVDGEVEIPNFLFRCSLMQGTGTAQELEEASKLQPNCCFQFSTFLSTCTLDAFSGDHGVQNMFRPQLVWLIYTQPVQPGGAHDWNPPNEPLSPRSRDTRIVVDQHVTNARQRCWQLPARKIVSRSLFRDESEWLFPPWSTCVFRLERVLVRDGRNFNFIVNAKNRCIIGDSVQVVLIVKAEEYDPTSHEDHRALRALKFT